MNKYSTEDRVFFTISYYERNRSVADTLRAWSSKHKNRPKPLAATVRALIEKFERTGSVLDDKEALKTAEKTVRTPENMELLRESIETNPSLSIRDLERDHSIPRSTVHRILRKDLGIFPYKIQVAQRLQEYDIERRLEFANTMCEMIDREHFDVNKIIFSDEAHFYLDGYVNRQNYRIWGSQKPEITVTKPLHPDRVTVWAGLCSKGILGPYFTPDGEYVDQFVYHDILEEAFEEANSKGWIEDCWFQQDGAPSHIAGQNLNLIREHFGGRVISRNQTEKFGEGLNWPPFSPDLTPMDFFL